MAKFSPLGTSSQQTSGSICGRQLECYYLRADEEAAWRKTSKINTLIHHCCSGFPAVRASQGSRERQRVTFSTEQFSPSQGAEREAADYKTQSEAGGWGKDSVCWFCLVEGSE
jgi:hypothetical protein